ncbi:uncharacterized protein LOC114540636 [Dendronephthya gigantea]|uniref:uncharacterized protein LOC114540636 n=1 Tax=Dendronephthya gigantea TaxID=151771 RepID=UPI00106D6425|nr:uncharacterized protein LOC114540636 [Dendronephthya gigantea]
MAGILVSDTIVVCTDDIGDCSIQLCIGDIIEIPKEDKVNVLVISAFPDDYVPTPPSLIGQLYNRLNIDVRVLAKDKEEDLRSLHSCWWSKPLPDHLSFEKILCFEGGFKVGKTSPQVVGDIFRCLVPAMGNEETRVVMPLLAAGAQKFSKKQMLEELVTAAIHWIETGLSLRCLKIVLLEREHENTELILRFKKMKESYQKGRMEKQKEHLSEYDIYLSYCEEDKGRTEFIIQCLQKNSKSIKVFSKLQELDMYESWQQQLYDTITSCKRVVALITPAYLKSTSCSEQFNIALCLNRKLHHKFLIPLLLSHVSYMPMYMGITQYIDCREHDAEKIGEACVTVVERIVSYGADNVDAKRLTFLEPHYDVFMSYSHINEDVAKQVIKELRIYQPDINIFIDTTELKAGSAWQQALYEAIERSKVMIALISGHYLSSKVCIEELSLAIALQCQGTAKIWPVVIEPLSKNLPWLKLISPVQCFVQPSTGNFPGIGGLCKNILKDINASNCPSVENEKTGITGILEDVRKLLTFDCGHVSNIASGVMISQESESPPFNRSRQSVPNHVDIYVICSKEDAKYCQLFCKLLISLDQSLII